MHGRKATDTNGINITWHMFYISADNNPMAVVDYDGVVRCIPATWITFIEDVSDEVYNIEYIDADTVRLTKK